MPRKPLQGLSNCEEFFDVGAFCQGFQFRFPRKRTLQADVKDLGYHLGDAVNFPQGDVKGPSHIPYDGSGLHLAKGDDLGHVVVASVFFHDISEDGIPAFHTEVNIDIGHALSGWIQESLKYEAVANRVQVSNSESVGHKTAGRRTTPWPHRDIVLFGKANKVCNHEEVTRIAHFLDDPKLLLKAFGVSLGICCRKVRVPGTDFT